MNKLEVFQEDMNKVVYQLIDTHIKPLIDAKVLIKGKFEPSKEEVKEVFSKHFNFNTDDLGIQVIIFEDPINPIVCEYTYKGLVVDPIGYYVLDREKRHVSQIEILEQCVIQDTHKPISCKYISSILERRNGK